MTTTHKFQVGQRVEMTEKGKEECCTLATDGIVRFVYGRHLVVETIESISGYPDKFWQPAEAIADNTKYCPTCGQRLP